MASPPSLRPGPPGLRPRRPAPVAAERLAVRPRGDLAVVDLVPRDPAGAAPVVTVRADADDVVLDAVAVRGPEGLDVYASVFRPSAGASRVRRFRVVGGGVVAVEDVLVGGQGEVLWWMHVRDGAVVVREIGRGRSYVVRRLDDAVDVPA